MPLSSYSINHVKRLSSDNLTIVLLTMLFVSLITTLPVSLTTHFARTIDTLQLSLFQPLFLVALIVIFAIFGFLAYYMRGHAAGSLPADDLRARSRCEHWPLCVEPESHCNGVQWIWVLHANRGLTDRSRGATAILRGRKLHACCGR